ncbi:MAG: glycosyltransferase, partial [Thermoanaerobaculia bacterium]
MRVLFGAVGGSIAHAIRLAELRRKCFPSISKAAFVGEGAQLEYFSAGREVPFFESSFGPERWRGLANGTGSLRDLRQLRSTLRDALALDSEAIAQFRPDIVIHDTRLPLAIAASRADLPSIGIVSAPLLERCRLHLPEVLKAPFRNGSRVFELAARDLWRDDSGTWDDAFHIVADLPFLFGFDGAFPNSIGWDPLISAGLGHYPDWPSRGNRVYVNSGGRVAPERPLLDAASRLALQGFGVVISRIATERSMPQLNAMPFVNDAAAAQEADVVVAHGGAGMSYHALLAGTPMVLVPENLEQRTYAHLLEEHGVARLCRSGTEVPAAVAEVLADRNYSERCEL